MGVSQAVILRGRHIANRSDVRPLEPLDIVRRTVVGEGGMTNLAYTLSALYRPRSFRTSLLGVSRRSLSPRTKYSAWVLADLFHIRGLVAVRPRSGTRSWEVSHLYAGTLAESNLVRLVEKSVAASASRGAERVFLRLEAESDLIPLVRRTGFFPCQRETVYTSAVDPERAGHSLIDANARMRERRIEDEHDLFRMYNAATPVKVRQFAGMALDQWASSRERWPRRCVERVLETDGSIVAWVVAAGGFGRGYLELMLHPDYSAMTPDIVDAGLHMLGRTKTIISVVSEHMPAVGRALEARGFQVSGDLLMLVKSTARTVEEKVPAGSSLTAVE